MTLRNYFILCAVLLVAAVSAQSQVKVSTQPQVKVSAQPQVKVSGYLQAQYQHGQQDATLGVGTANERSGASLENPESSLEDSRASFERFGIRRGRVKFTATEGIASGVMQLDFTEKQVGLKDAYFNLRDPWQGVAQLRAGVFDRPFGHEIGYSSSQRESPERSTVFRTLFPQERDMGAMLTLQAPKSSAWHALKLEAGLFAGNGIQQETDSRKDFIGHLSAAGQVTPLLHLSGGVSHYSGSVYQGTEQVYRMSGRAFELDAQPTHKGGYARRRYTGFDAQATLRTVFGRTQLRTEYLFGQQPATATSSKSPNASSLPTTDTYLRTFNGAYAIVTQDIGRLPLAAVLKYDYYDPNTKVSGADIGVGGTSQADVAVHTFGAGALWQVTSAVRLQAYYEINRNEKAAQLAAWQSDRKDNVFTLRLQYKF